MKLAIMQPYFLPYIGYFQLIQSADIFILYDNIQYTKKGWINRNRLLRNGKDFTFSLPLKKQSDYLDIRDRRIADSFNRQKLLNQIKGAYSMAPYFNQTFSLVEGIINHNEENLFEFLYYSIKKICSVLEVSTEITKSSSVDIDHSLKKQSKIFSFCNAVGAKTYINAIGGQSLYSSDDFNERGIALKFLSPKLNSYSQFTPPFIAGLSIVDILMFNSRELIKETMLREYELI
ncbi:WbqC-like protein [Kiloniella spongiae]|uniref:WbqC-like protein n=1 Tax=Kiloniella spongiae TaxID=1489064 RepID=A0A0H2MCL6_9PROT|nr:WbqC family protein [Kiloniella spongiae]KLN60319.1 WbqC-like protein [Kiloniella spongiae]